MRDSRDFASELWKLCDVITPCAVRSAATLRLADHIAAGRTQLPALAAATDSSPAALGDLLRLLSARGLFTEPEPDVFQLTSLGEVLRDDHPAGVRRWLDLHGGMARSDLAFSRLVESVRTGAPAYQLVFGRSFWEDLDADLPYRRAVDELWNARLTDQASQVAAAYEWSQIAHLVDVGGGSGVQLRAILSRCPTLRATLLDLPRAAAEAAALLRAAGLAERVTTISASFFDELPGGADAYLLSEVLHNWSDADARRILRRCADAVSPGGRVLIVEGVVDDRYDIQHTAASLRMLVTLGGRERSREDFRRLASSCGLRLARVIDTGARCSIIECLSSAM